MAKPVEHYLLDEGEPDEAMIRRWAFDPDAELMEQDEDLVLHDWRFAATILDLAADPSCPKSDYILGIWDDFTRHHTVHQDPSDLEEAGHALSLAEKYKDHSGIKHWIADQTARLRCVSGMGVTDRATALWMGNLLLNGKARSCPIDVLRESESAFLVQLSVPHGTHKEWLLIERATGKFRYSRYWPAGANEPSWFDPRGSTH
jgi:hypothetical protein